MLYHKSQWGKDHSVCHDISSFGDICQIFASHKDFQVILDVSTLVFHFNIESCLEDNRLQLQQFWDLFKKPEFWVPLGLERGSFHH